MKFLLKTLSPIHIGSGKSLQPFDYIIDGNEFHRIDLNKATSIGHKLDNDFPSNLSKWISDIVNKLVDLESNKNRDNRRDYNQQLSAIKKDFNIKFFCNSVLKNSKLFEAIKKEAVLYSCQLPVGMQKKMEVNELLRDTQFKPYIPGTSIKGVIRTAILSSAFNSLDSNAKKILLSELKNIFSEVSFQKKDYRPQKADDFLAEYFFSCKSNSGKASDAQLFNIMKFIRVTDAHPVGDNDELIKILPTNLYQINKDSQGQSPAIEAISEAAFFSFDLSVDTVGLKNALANQRNDKWFNLSTKISRIFGSDFNSLSSDNLENELIHRIMKMLSDFSNTMMDKEIRWLKLSSENTFQNLANFYQSIDSGKNLIRLGWASGFLGTTIFTSLASTDPIFVQDYFMKFKIGIPKKRDNNNVGPELTPPNLNKFPKSKRLSSDEDSIALYPYGWTQVLPAESKSEFLNVKLSYSSSKAPARPTEPQRVFENPKVIQQGSSVLGVVLECIKPNLIVKIEHQMSNGEYTIKYPAGLEVGTKVILNVTQMQKGKISQVKFSKIYS